jgi:NAD(P)H-dependent FMN reductase
MTRKLNNDNGLQTRWARTPAHNRRLAQWLVQWLKQGSTSHQTLWCVDSLVLRNQPLRQAPKRYRAFKKDEL